MCQWCKLVLTELQAQTIIYLACIKLSGSTPAVGPTVNNHAVAEPSPQKVLSVTVAPNLAKKASPPFNP